MASSSLSVDRNKDAGNTSANININSKHGCCDTPSTFYSPASPPYESVSPPCTSPAPPSSSRSSSPRCSQRKEISLSHYLTRLYDDGYGVFIDTGFPRRFHLEQERKKLDAGRAAQHQALLLLARVLCEHHAEEAFCKAVVHPRDKAKNPKLECYERSRCVSIDSVLTYCGMSGAPLTVDKLTPSLRLLLIAAGEFDTLLDALNRERKKKNDDALAGRLTTEEAIALVERAPIGLLDVNDDGDVLEKMVDGAGYRLGSIFETAVELLKGCPLLPERSNDSDKNTRFFAHLDSDTDDDSDKENDDGEGADEEEDDEMDETTEDLWCRINGLLEQDLLHTEDPLNLRTALVVSWLGEEQFKRHTSILPAPHALVLLIGFLRYQQREGLCRTDFKLRRAFELLYNVSDSDTRDVAAAFGGFDCKYELGFSVLEVEIDTPLRAMNGEPEKKRRRTLSNTDDEEEEDEEESDEDEDEEESGDEEEKEKMKEKDDRAWVRGLASNKK